MQDRCRHEYFSHNRYGQSSNGPGAKAAFMHEPRFQDNHRANILNANYTDVEIGMVEGPNGDLYITQDFAQFRLTVAA
jgi:uncharacterized protein YkwD